MTATLKISIQKSINNGKRKLRLNKTSRKHQHIRIIMSAGKARKLNAPAQSSTHTLMLIQSHPDAIAAATHRNTGINTPALNRSGTRMCKIRIIATISTISAKILRLNALALKIALYDALKFKTRMIAAQSNRHSTFQNTHNKLINN